MHLGKPVDIDRLAEALVDAVPEAGGDARQAPQSSAAADAGERTIRFQNA